MSDSSRKSAENKKSSAEFISDENSKNEIILRNLKTYGELSEAEIKFLSLSKEKADGMKIIDNLISNTLTLKNYYEFFCLQNCYPDGGTINPEQSVRNIRYKDKSGTIVAIVQIDTVNKKIRMQNLGDILPKQECFTPAQIGIKLQNMSKYKNWITEDGGVNQFNKNTEFRYKDKFGNVMAAIIKKPNGTFDTIAEYEYQNGYRSQMLVTNQYGQSRVIYDGTEAVNQLTRIDIDTNGIITEVTKIYSDYS